MSGVAFLVVALTSSLEELEWCCFLGGDLFILCWMSQSERCCFLGGGPVYNVLEESN